MITSFVAGFYAFVHLSNPIVLDGFSSTSLNPDGSMDISYSFYNAGVSKIQIQEVFLDDVASKGTIDLGISHDTTQIVQAGTTSPNTLFYNLQEKTIHPRLSEEEITEALNKKVMTPIFYGIRIKEYKGPIHTIAIQYKYLGLTVTKEFHVNEQF